MGTPTDPLADMLTSIRNALQARHTKVDVPASRLKAEVARILKEEGFLAAFKLIEENKRKVLRLYLKYGPDKQSVISGLRRISKPGRRVYADKTSLPRVLGGMGIAIVSTSQGLLTGQEARRRGVGGEVLCTVW